MGTIAFDAKPGEIVDVGLVKASAIDALTFPNLLDKADAGEVEGLRSGSITMMRWTPQNGSLPVDPRLTGYKVVSAEFKPAGPVPNYYGVQVDRMTAIPGILAYDRDRIIDPSSPATSSAGH